MQPTLRPTAAPGHGRTVCVLDGLLSPGECAALIAATERAGFEPMGALYPPGYRDNDRALRHDPALAASLFTRARARLPAEYREAPGVVWRLRGLNPHFRLCRYQGGQRFARHRDGPFVRGPEERSWLTLMVYLNEGAAAGGAGFHGGRTRFYAGPEEEARLEQVLIPRTGDAALFAHGYWHDGEAVERGRKYVLRTDVVYRREGGPPDGLLRHDNYVWCLAEPAPGLLASGGRDGVVRLWRARAAGWSAEVALVGHQGSVTALAGAEGALWSGDRRGQLRRTALDGRAAVAVGAHRGALLALAPLPGGHVASAGADGRLCRWAPSAELLGAVDAGRGWMWALVADPAGSLFCGGDDGRIIGWPPGSRLAAPAVLGEVGEGVRALALDAAQGILAFGTASGRVGTLSLRGGAPPSIRQVHRGAVCALAALGEGRFASGGEDGRLQLLDVRGAHLLAERPDFVRAVLRLADGRLASAGYDQQIRLDPLAAPAAAAGRAVP